MIDAPAQTWVASALFFLPATRRHMPYVPPISTEGGGRERPCFRLRSLIALSLLYLFPLCSSLSRYASEMPAWLVGASTLISFGPPQA
jgi:hypothetical protein